MRLADGGAGWGLGCDAGARGTWGGGRPVRCPLCKAAPGRGLSKQSAPTGCTASEGVSTQQSRASWSQHAQGSPCTGPWLRETVDELGGLHLGWCCLPPTGITTPL